MLRNAVYAICQPGVSEAEVVRNQLVNLAVVAHHGLMPGVEWIKLCQRAGVDPGELAREKAARLVGEVRMYTGLSGRSACIRDAALRSVATLAFVAPETVTPLVVAMVEEDLAVQWMHRIGEVEVGMWRMEDGVAYVDVLKRDGGGVVEKGKGAETARWEAELRAQLASKKGERKLTGEEKARVEEQLEKERVVRRRVEDVKLRLSRGIGVVRCLAEGPPTMVELWMGRCVRALLKAMEAGAGLVVGDEGVKAFLVSGFELRVICGS